MEKKQKTNNSPEATAYMKNCLKIEMAKNAIRFKTPEGKTFYKNFDNFNKAVEKASKQKAEETTFTFAPEATQRL